MTPDELQRLLADIEADRVEPVPYARRRRPVALVLAVSLGVGAVCALAGAAVLVLAFHRQVDGAQPYVSGAIIGAGTFLAAGGVQPRSARRRRHGTARPVTR